MQNTLDNTITLYYVKWEPSAMILAIDVLVLMHLQKNFLVFFAIIRKFENMDTMRTRRLNVSGSQIFTMKTQHMNLMIY
jgi:hypothetical protein